MDDCFLYIQGVDRLTLSKYTNNTHYTDEYPGVNLFIYTDILYHRDRPVSKSGRFDELHCALQCCSKYGILSVHVARNTRNINVRKRLIQRMYHIKVYQSFATPDTEYRTPVNQISDIEHVTTDHWTGHWRLTTSRMNK